jgi:hypothetical protein
MLMFGEFASDQSCGCVLHADAGNDHVRFDIRGVILTDSLGGGNPIHQDDNVKLRDQKRSMIEAACRHAYAERPAHHIALEQRHFY